MNIKITENLVPGGLGNHRTRSRVTTHPDGEPLPESAVATDEEARDWRVDPVLTETE